MPRFRWLVALRMVLSFSTISTAAAQDAGLPNYAPLLPQAKARAWQVDPLKGYAVRELKPNVFMVTDGGYQALFVTTTRGVTLFDAPPSVASHIGDAVADVTSEHIVRLVYSHAHVDHIGGAGRILRQNPNIEIVAEEGVARFLRDQKDPTRPEPTRAFKERETLTLGAVTADLKVGYWHSPPGDLFISLPSRKILMAVDTMSSGSVPFMGFDLTMNMDAYLKVFDQLLAYDFDILVPGHHSNPSTRDDVKLVKDYVMDVYGTIKRIHESDHGALVAQAREKYGRENSYPAARVLIDSEVEQCAQEIGMRWISKLDSVDVWAPSQCRAALVYFEWDVGARRDQK
jgi:glyoxylase-like metal-dependent hydrolase (beta-lactamase superfamily II)